MYYIAGPIFNTAQKDVIKDIEDILDKHGLDYFSPREFGVIADEPMNPERMKRIFDMNIRMLNECDSMIAVLDDRDAGTIFELGHFFAASGFPWDEKEPQTIITFSGQGHGCNVMLKHAVRFHCNGYMELESALRGFGTNDLEISE